jgi:glycine/D-amino acid oxidase-like deaminating enzyme
VTPHSAEVIVIGDGLIGLAAATTLAARLVPTVLIAAGRPGAASPASGGALAPSLDAGTARYAFGIASRDRYPSWLAEIRDRVGADVLLQRDGLIELLGNDADESGELPAGAVRLDRDALRELEPGLAGAASGVLHPYDGAVDHRMLLDALWAVAATLPDLTIVRDMAVALRGTPMAMEVTLAEDHRVASAAHVVLAAGAWTPGIAGLPRELPIEPVRGEVIELEGMPARHPVFAPGGYLVPHRGRATLVGSTMERVGYDYSTSPAAAARLARAAAAMAPGLAGARVLSHAAGLRPITPDLLPILGPDPADRRLIHASGHSKNGVLMAPLTADCVAAWVCGEPVPADVEAFRADRF